MPEFNPEKDEITVLEEAHVSHGGIFVYRHSLILTNKRIVCLHKGVFGDTQTISIYPLDRIKVFSGVPQVQMGKTVSGIKCLDIDFSDGREQFSFLYKNRRTIEKWIHEIMALLSGNTEKENNSEAGEAPDETIRKCPDGGTAFDSFARQYAAADTYRQKADLVRTFVIPGTKEDILEFMTLAASNIDEESYTRENVSVSGGGSKRDVSDAWAAGMEQAYQKAKLVFGDFNEVLLIDKIHSEKTQQIETAKNKRHRADRWESGKKYVIAAALFLLALLCVSVILLVFVF